jgi:hypothetical protein
MLTARALRSRFFAGVAVAALGVGGCSASAPGDLPRASTDAGADVHLTTKAPVDSGVYVPEEKAPFVELPRLAADPSLTRRILDRPASLVGSGKTGCSSGSSPERWCAFDRPSSEGGAGRELWVMNVSKAIRGAAIACDENGPDCFRLTSNLFTGSQLWGVSHPYDNRFEGDTLIFYADAAPDTPDPYVGPAFAWRPGWAHARQLDTAQGGMCFAEHRSPVVFCTDSVVVTKSPDAFAPNLRELDLLAGPIDDVSGGPLPKVAHLAADGPGSLGWRARFAAGGSYFAYSSFSETGNDEMLSAIKTADTATGQPSLVLPNVAEWEIANDATKVYFLRDYDRTLGPLAQGPLMMADFPTGESTLELQPSVAEFVLLGSQGGLYPDVDKGVAFYTLYRDDNWTLSLMPDRSSPAETHRLGQQPNHAQVSTDTAHAVFVETRDKSAYAARTDGTKLCRLTNDPNAETYGTQFSDSGGRVFWIEYGREGNVSEEGWYARPDDCSQKTKYGDYVTIAGVVGDDFVVFTGGDAQDSTAWLQFSPLVGDGSVETPAPTIIVEKPASAARTSAAEGTFVLYTKPAEGDQGIYLFGPLSRSR